MGVGRLFLFFGFLLVVDEFAVGIVFGEVEGAEEGCFPF